MSNLGQNSHPALRIRGLEDDQEDEQIPDSISEFRAHTKRVNEKLDSDLGNYLKIYIFSFQIIIKFMKFSSITL